MYQTMFQAHMFPERVRPSDRVWGVFHKTAFLLVVEILMNFSGYLPLKRKLMRNLDRSAPVNIITTTALIKLHLHKICINFQVVCFTDNLREFAHLNTVYEELIKLHILTDLNTAIIRL